MRYYKSKNFELGYLDRFLSKLSEIFVLGLHHSMLGFYLVDRIFEKFDKEAIEYKCFSIRNVT